MAQYLKPDSELGYVEDMAEIEFLKFNNLRHSILGCMLGDFDELGSYVVSPEVVKELISMEKYIVETYDNIELCRSTLKLDKQISFIVTLEGNKATLSLIEKLNYEANFTLNSGTYSNINEYVLDTVETSGEVNRNVLYARWNIKTNPGNIIDIFNCDDSVLEKYFGIVNRFKYLLRANSMLLKKESIVEEFEADYSKFVLDILQRYPNLNKAIIEDIKTNLKEKKDSISVKKPFFVKSFNELLENAIQKNLSLLTQEEKDEFQKEKRNALVELNIKRQDALEIEEVEVESKTQKSLTPKVIQIKSSFEEERKNLFETAQELVSEHKRVADRVAGNANEKFESQLIRRTILAVGEKKGNDVELPPENQTEKNQLIAMLTALGIGDLIGVDKEEEKSVNPETKASANQAQVAKKAAASSNSKVGTIKTKDIKYDPPNDKTAKSTKRTTSKKGNETTTTKEETVVQRILSGTSGNVGKGPNEQKPDVKKSNDVVLLSNAELEKIEKKRNASISKTTTNDNVLVVSEVDLHVETDVQVSDTL